MSRSADLDTLPFGLLGYPVLMAADILIPRANLVPVGEDNRGNVELARELVRRFNHMYGEVFTIPEIEAEGTLIGTDGGAKMSKSLNNTILLSDPPDDVHKKVMSMYTDPNRIRADIPGTVEGNPLFIYHDLFNQDGDQVIDFKNRYRQGQVGDVEVKQALSIAINEFLDPIRKKREDFSRSPELVLDILSDGAKRMQLEAEETLVLVKQAMGLEKYRQKSQNKYRTRQLDKAVEGLAFM
jgi:tryptophanyl-tRNA synthetase